MEEKARQFDLPGGTDAQQGMLAPFNQEFDRCRRSHHFNFDEAG
jgi:hypothetical protein